MDLKSLDRLPLVLGSIFAITGLLVVAAAPIAVNAAETSRLGAYPTNYDESNPYSRSWFIYSLPAGQTKTDSVTVVNQTDEVIKVKLYPVDATTTQDGAFALRNEDEDRKGVGSWVSLDSSELTLAPKDRQEVKFTISIPEYATVGDHAGGIIIQEMKAAQEQRNGMNVNIISRLGVRIYQTVPGDQQLSLSIAKFEQSKTADGAGSQFTFELSNNGNVFLSPTGTITIKDILGKTVETIKLDNLGTVVPGKPLTKTISSSVKQSIAQRYQATLQINYSPTKAATKQISYWWVNWQLATPIAAALSLVLIGGLVVLLKRRQSPLKASGLELVPTEHSVGHWVTLSRQANIEQLINKDRHQALVSDKEIDRVFLAHHIRLIVGSILIGAIGFSVIIAVFLFNFSVVVMSKDSESSSTVAGTSSTPAPTSTPIASSSATLQPSSTESATPKPTITPLPKELVKVSIMNGSGLQGVATKAADAIRDAGFTVTTIGNDFSSGATKATVRYPENRLDEAHLISDALANLYDSIDVEPLEDESEEFVFIAF